MKKVLRRLKRSTTGTTTTSTASNSNDSEYSASVSPLEKTNKQLSEATCQEEYVYAIIGLATQVAQMPMVFPDVMMEGYANLLDKLLQGTKQDSKGYAM